MNAILRKRLPLLLSILSGLLMWGGWPTSPLTFLVFIGLTPLLAITDRVKDGRAYFGLLFLAFWIWNTGTTWWVGNTTVPASGIFANAFNALLMTIPWWGYKRARLRTGRLTGYFALIVYWLTFEYIHQQWELSWPWLTLGNAFAMRPAWVQWYEYTGTMGGSLWVLLMNILVYQAWRRGQHEPGWFFLWKEGWKPLLLLALPLAISYGVITGESEATEPSKSVVIVQPNIDPYDEKFSDGAAMDQLHTFLALTEEKTDSSTRFVIWPETALFPQGAWEHLLNDQPEVMAIRAFLNRHPQVKIVTGASTFKRYLPTDEVPSTARVMNGEIYYDAFNSTLQIDTSLNIQVYHQAKLVPGVELTPYMRYLPFMKKLALDLGGISGSYGLTPGVPLFFNPDERCNIFTAICYESVYGDFVAEKVRQGANLLVVCTNDGWWGDTEGHRQHLQYARLRAIETRRWVARSANTGISAFVSPRGEVIKPQPYWEPAVIQHAVTPYYHQTFYVKYGGFTAKAPLIFCILLVAYTIVLRVIRRHYVENI